MGFYIIKVDQTVGENTEVKKRNGSDQGYH